MVSRTGFFEPVIWKTVWLFKLLQFWLVRVRVCPPCACQRERDVLYLCCAFSAVVAAFGHMASCESRREKMEVMGSLWLIIPHLILSLFFFHFIPTLMPVPTYFSPPSLSVLSGGIISNICSAAEPWLHSKHSELCGWVDWFMRWFSFSSDFCVYFYLPV